MAWEIVGMLSLVAFCAGFFDAIAGGGGLITLPALFLAGVPPVSAIATNKFQAAAATLSATAVFARKGLIHWHEGRFLILFGMLGGGSGALLVSSVNTSLLQTCVPILLILVAMYFTIAPKFLTDGGKKRMSTLLFSFLIAPLLGFYDGVFGPGVGAFLMAGFISLCGLSMMHAMSFTKLTNASCNIGSLLIFITQGMIVWQLAIAMALSSFVGAQLGARCAVRVGPRLIKPMLIVVSFALAIKLLSAEDNPLRVALFNLF